VTFEESDRYLLANLIYCEAGGEPYDGKLAVGAVVINRVLSSVYPDTVTGVIYQNKQFSPVGSGRLALALANGKATQACYQAADEAMSGVTNVGSCVYFRTPIPGLTGISIGGHIFY
jgi:spore germination cell wall hydrolase CwlJ-like protein